MDTNDLGPAFCDQLGVSKLDFGAWNRAMRKSRNCCKVRAVSSTFRWKIRFMSVSLCASLRSAMTRAIKAERLSEIGNRFALPLLCTLQTCSMAECLMARHQFLHQPVIDRMRLTGLVIESLIDSSFLNSLILN